MCLAGKWPELVEVDVRRLGKNMEAKIDVLGYFKRSQSLPIDTHSP
jgi:hypothetical protein